MAKRKIVTKDSCNDFKSLDKALTKSPNFKSKRNGKGSHVVWTSTSGGAVTAYRRKGDYPKGTKSGLWKLVIASGFFGCIVMWWMGVVAEVWLVDNGLLLITQVP